MNPRSRPEPATVAAAIALAAVAALGAAWGLRALATPSQFQARMSALNAESAQAKALLSRRPQPAVTASADCAGSTEATIEKLRRDLAAVTTTARLAPPRIEVTPAVRGPGDAGLQPLDVRLDTSGGYDAVIAGVAGLANLRPTIFVETAELRGRVSDVTLSLKGRAYCASQR